MKQNRRKSLFRRSSTTKKVNKTVAAIDCCNPLKICDLNKILGVFCFWTMFVFVFIVLSLIAGFLVYRLGGSVPSAPQQTETAPSVIQHNKLPVDAPTITTVPSVQGNNFFDFGGVVIVEQPPTAPTHFFNSNYNIQNNFVNHFQIPCCEPTLQINSWMQWNIISEQPPVIDRFVPNNQHRIENQYRINCVPDPSSASLAAFGAILMFHRRR